jgi:hypothetical protein
MTNGASLGEVATRAYALANQRMKYREDETETTTDTVRETGKISLRAGATLRRLRL